MINPCWRESRLALNEVDGTQLSFIKKELEKLIKGNERITRKEIAEYFGVLTHGCIMNNFFVFIALTRSDLKFACDAG